MRSATANDAPTAQPSGTPATISFVTTTPTRSGVGRRQVEHARAERESGGCSASIATTALELRICFAVVNVGNVSGTQIEKITTITANT